MRVLVAALACVVLAPGAGAQSTAFTYQGQLRNGVQPASGPHDMRFRLFDAATGGAQVGATQCADNVPVTGGTFAVLVDFGQQFASSQPRFLEIEVRADSGLGCASGAGFVALTPRQRLTAAPIANHARSAFALDAPDGAPLGAVIVDNDGRIGVGTPAPGAPLHLIAPNTGPLPGEGIRIQGTQATGANQAYVSFANGAGTQIGYVGDGGGGDDNVYLGSYGADIGLVNSTFGVVLTAKSTGLVGIGTTTPNAKLDVDGNVHTTGRYLGDAPVQRYKTIHGSAFQHATEAATSNPITVRYADGIVGIRQTGGLCTENYYYAPVELPDGAVITNVLFTYYDNGACGTYGELYRLNLFNGQLNTMVTFPFDDFNGTTVKIVGSSNITLATVDNSTYAYILRVHVAGLNRESGGYMRLLGARIRYETNVPYP